MDMETEWKRVRNIRKDSFDKSKGSEAWVPLVEVTEDRDKLLEEINRLKTLAEKMFNTYNNDRDPDRMDHMLKLKELIDKIP